MSWQAFSFLIYFSTNLQTHPSIIICRRCCIEEVGSLRAKSSNRLKRPVKQKEELISQMKSLLPVDIEVSNIQPQQGGSSLEITKAVIDEMLQDEPVH